MAKDYFIAQGHGGDAMAGVKSFYSEDCLVWAQLPQVHEVIAASALKIKSRFTGTLGFEKTVAEPGPSPSDAPLELPAEVAALRKEDAKEDGTTVYTTVTEVKRLAALVAAIDHECATVPRGAYLKAADGTVAAKRHFEGLSTADAGKLQNYFHLRPALLEKTPLERSQVDKSIDFLDPLSADVPTGCWSLQYERGGQATLLRSLKWPGFVFFHCPGTSKYGRVYMGTGQKNADLAFMLP